MGERVKARGRMPGSLRIIGGRWRGRRIALPADTRARPTPDRVRETLFNWLAPSIEGARCLDLFAGSGALGIEALSRGAAAVAFVERNRELAAAIRGNLTALSGGDMSADASVHVVSAERFLRENTGPFDIVFVDPPYDRPLQAVLERVLPLASGHAQIYTEREITEGLPTLAGLQWRKRSRAGRVCYGIAAVRPA